MGDAEEFSAEGFSMYREASDKAVVNFMDETQEIPYTAKCFINRKNTIGYCEAFMKDKHEFMFLSKTEKGIVMTASADKEGPLPMVAPGIHIVYGTPPDSPPEVMLAMHKRAMGSEPPLVEEEWLKRNIPTMPQKFIDMSMVLMNQMLEALGGADGLMQAMGDALAGAVEGIGKGIGDALQTSTEPEVDAPPPELTQSEEPDNPAPWEVKPKRSPPKKAAPKKAPPKKAAPKKKPAPKKAPPKKKAPAKPKAKPKKGKKKR